MITARITKEYPLVYGSGEPRAWQGKDGSIKHCPNTLPADLAGPSRSLEPDLINDSHAA